ncbi:MAG: aminopeptidase N C-terminal domain-containing protein, partial [Kistimonas sp.]|nr:aminopeptidase N C-terminal domain-containing protein [Kistimonas sp.]
RVLLHAQHDSGVSATQEVLADFAARWKDDTNVMDLWFSSQASCPRSGALARVEALMAHPAFDGKNPNKMRALIAAFCDGNLVQFHDRSGAGYALLEREVVRADAFNPQLAARLVTPLTFWKRYDKERQQLMRATLERLQGKELSRDLFEVVNKSLAWAD